MTEFLEPYDPRVGELFRQVALKNTQIHLELAQQALAAGDEEEARRQVRLAGSYGDQILSGIDRDQHIDRHTGMRWKPMWTPTGPEYED